MKTSASIVPTSLGKSVLSMMLTFSAASQKAAKSVAGKSNK